MRPGPFLLAALFRMFCVSPSARAFSIVPFPVLHPGGGSSRALRQSLLWRDGNIAVWRRLPLEIGRADFLGLQQDSEVHTFQPVEVRGEGGQEGFRVLPPDLWPHGSDPCKVKPEVWDVLIKPGFGWGEGLHPTTNMCLHFLLDHLPTLQAPSMLDYGTGSGVLAIAARRLGAKRVVGVDKDDEILDCAQENAILNFGKGHILEFVHGREVATGSRGIYLQDGMLHSFDVVVANMLAPALVRLAPSITSAVKEDAEVNGVGGGGILALSGMRREQVRDVRAAYESQGVIFFEEKAKEGAAPGAEWAEWVLLKGMRKQLSEEEAKARAAMLSEAAVG